MLIYHPAFDIYHCMFRMIRLLSKLPKQSYEIERIRILDFYLLFPQQLKNVRFPREAVGYKKLFKERINPYEKIEDPLRIFLRLEAYQKESLNCLASYNIIDAKLLSEGKIQRTANEIPKELDNAIEKANSRFPEVIELLTGPFINIDLYGNSGLKARTELFEHRYDPS